MASQQLKKDRDDELFEQLAKKRKRKRSRRIVTTILIIAVVITGAYFGVKYLKKHVAENYANNDGFITNFAATIGSINTTISGTGTLKDVDVETITVPGGIEILDVVVEPNEKVHEGDVVATLHLPSVMKVMTETQTKINNIDAKLKAASDDSVSSFINASVAGRVKVMYANDGDDVISTMYEHGALALLSLDGYMAADILTDEVLSGAEVTVIRADGSEISGTVESCAAGKAVILVTDNGPEMDEMISVRYNGSIIGTAPLYIHCPLRVTAVSGTVSYRYPLLGQSVQPDAILFRISDTDFTANYDALLRERTKQEEKLLELVELYRRGAVLAPFTGTVESVEFGDSKETTAKTSDSSQSSMMAAMSGYANIAGLSQYSALASMTGSSATESKNDSSENISIIKLSPDKEMMIEISVDEKNILAVEKGQIAAVTVASVSDQPFKGAVSKVSKSSVSSSGVTKYSAEITLDKTEAMLSGMSATAKVRVEGVDDAVLVPVAAVNQTSEKAYVYTGYDAELQEFTGLTEVTTGLSNGTYIEITSGLKEGDNVCYSRTLVDMFSSRRSGSDKIPENEFAFEMRMEPVSEG